jgi:uncharacterized protein with gpF-like domain
VAVDWEGERRRRGAEMAEVEKELFGSFRNVLEQSLAFIEPRILGGGRPDARGAFAAQGTWSREAAAWVEEELRPVAERPLRDIEVIPASETLISNYLAGAKNRLVNVPDRVYDLVKAEIEQGVNAGTPNEELVEKISELFAAENIDAWDGRVMTIVRTEAIAAQNAGNFASFLSLAALDPGTEWEKAWLATEDRRTRPTHERADQQRVPLKEAFRVGGSRLMYPGDPSGEPEEVINCRCSLLLLEPGEEIDLSNRQFEGD